MSYNKKAGIRDIIRRALKEDMGSGDITTKSLIPKNSIVKAALISKQDCVICGLSIVSQIFKLSDKNIRFKPLAGDGDFVKKGRTVAIICGRAQSILSLERVALNFLAHLSGISTKTRKFVNAVKPYKARIMDTRKTTPGLRLLEKYAVRLGGGYNHRMSLDEMVLIKDNHLKVIGYRFAVIGEIRKKIGVRIEIEVNNLKEFKSVLKHNPDIIMLDNMSIKDMKRAVMLRNNRKPNTENRIPKLEASGGVKLKNIRRIAKTGVDMISVGELTHSAPAVDICLEII